MNEIAWVLGHKDLSITQALLTRHRSDRRPPVKERKPFERSVAAEEAETLKYLTYFFPALNLARALIPIVSISGSDSRNCARKVIISGKGTTDFFRGNLRRRRQGLLAPGCSPSPVQDMDGTADTGVDPPIHPRPALRKRMPSAISQALPSMG